MMRKEEYSVSVDLPLQIIKEGNVFVAYCPALDIATQGDTLPEAQKMFNEFVSIFIDELIEMGTLEKVLFELGWKKISRGNRWEPPEREIIKDTYKTISIPCPT